MFIRDENKIIIPQTEEGRKIADNICEGMNVSNITYKVEESTNSIIINYTIMREVKV